MEAERILKFEKFLTRRPREAETEDDSDNEDTENLRAREIPDSEAETEHDSDNGDRKNLGIREIPNSEAEIEDDSDNEDNKKMSEKLRNITSAETQGLSSSYLSVKQG
ncbi:hypothetical protein MMC12_006245 [Toensbergia leucococca]|nr:hypothetical protein [Toensbergia leucococca]